MTDPKGSNLGCHVRQHLRSARALVRTAPCGPKDCTLNTAQSITARTAAPDSHLPAAQRLVRAADLAQAQSALA